MADASLLIAGFGRHADVRHDVVTSLLDPLKSDWDDESRDVALHTLALPWSHARAPSVLAERLVASRPDLFVLLDVEPASPDHVLQVFAANWVDDATPDVDGQVVRETIIEPNGPVAYRSRLPLDGVWDKFLVERVPCRMGHKAGWSVFNHVYYRAMRTIDLEGLDTLGGAVQVPPTPAEAQDVQGRDLDARIEDIDMMLMTIRHLFAKVERDEEREAAKQGRR